MSQYGAMWAAKLPIQDRSFNETTSNVTEVRAEQLRKNSLFNKPKKTASTADSNPDNFTTNYVRLVQEMIAEYKQEMS